MKDFEILVLDPSLGVTDSDLTIATLPNSGVIPVIGDQLTVKGDEYHFTAQIVERGIDYVKKQITLWVDPDEIDYY